jgi:glutathione S-transferase
MRAVLRYRRIPYQLIIRNSREDVNLPQPKVGLIPQLLLPDEKDPSRIVAQVDSTPLIRRFENEFSGRAVVPPDPVLAFIDYLLEDYADEWLTKAMFHYRWAYQADIDKAAAVLPLWSRVNIPDAKIAPVRKMIAERQVGRLYVVGSNATTGPVIEESYRRFLRLFDAHLQGLPFLMGSRPGASDFATLGQLTQLAAFDPTPAALTAQEAPRVLAWVEVMEDLSGLEPAEEDWTTRETVPETLRALLSEAGRVYAPFLLANAQALEKGADTVECTIAGKPWVQQPFPYQGKCLQRLREQRESLSADDRAALDSLLAGSGCETLF